MEAEHLLRSFPALWEQACLSVEDALEGSSHGDLTGTGRRPTGVVSDPTARRGIALLEAGDLSAQLNLIREWIDNELLPKDRPLLFAVWRQHGLGWPVTAKELDLEVDECLQWWNEMVTRLTEWLTSTL